MGSTTNGEETGTEEGGATRGRGRRGQGEKKETEQEDAKKRRLRGRETGAAAGALQDPTGRVTAALAVRAPNGATDVSFNWGCWNQLQYNHATDTAQE